MFALLISLIVAVVLLIVTGIFAFLVVRQKDEMIDELTRKSTELAEKRQESVRQIAFYMNYTDALNRELDNAYSSVEMVVNEMVKTARSKHILV